MSSRFPQLSKASCFRLRWAAVIALCLVFGSPGVPHSSLVFGPPASQAQNVTPAAPAKIQLNGDDMGTADDLSLLTKKLADRVKIRKEQHAYKRGMERRTDLLEDERIEKTVYVKAERSIKLEDVTRVIEAVNAAGAGPVLLPIQAAGNLAARMKPDPLVLLVRIKQPNSSPSLDASGLPSISDFLISGGIPIVLSNEDWCASVFVIPKDGEYLLGAKRIEKSALENEIRERLKAQPASEKIVFLKTSPEISFGSLEDIYSAAVAAGAKLIDLDVIKTGEAITDSITWADQDLKFTLPSGWRRHQIDSETFVLRGPDGARLSVDLLDKEGDVVPDVTSGYEHLLQEQKQGTYDEVRILEVDGLKGLLARWSGGEFDPHSTHLRWQTFRKRKGKLQYIQINIAIRTDCFKTHQQELSGILDSIKVGQR